MKKAAVAKITNEKGQILFLLRAKSPFGLCFPGGKLDNGESPEQACIREVFEETGIQLLPNQIRFVNNSVSHNGRLVSIFEADLNYTPEIKVNPEEHLYAKWIKPLEANLENYDFAGNTLAWLNLSKS